MCKLVETINGAYNTLRIFDDGVMVLNGRIVSVQQMLDLRKMLPTSEVGFDLRHIADVWFDRYFASCVW